MKPKATFAEGKTALDSFTRTMKALFRVPKTDVVEPEPKPKPTSQKKSSKGRP